MLANLCKLIGISIDYNSICELCGYTKKEGTDDFGVNNALKALNVKYRKRNQTCLVEMVGWLERGNILLVGAFHSDESKDGHYFVLTHGTEKRPIVAINLHYDKLIQRFTIKGFASKINWDKDIGVWIIRKNDEKEK